MRRDKSEVASQKASLCFHTQFDTPIIQILGHCLAMSQNSMVPISVNITRDWGHYIPHGDTVTNS